MALPALRTSPPCTGNSFPTVDCYVRWIAGVALDPAPTNLGDISSWAGRIHPGG